MDFIESHPTAMQLYGHMKGQYDDLQLKCAQVMRKLKEAEEKAKEAEDRATMTEMRLKEAELKLKEAEEKAEQSLKEQARHMVNASRKRCAADQLQDNLSKLFEAHNEEETPMSKAAEAEFKAEMRARCEVHLANMTTMRGPAEIKAATEEMNAEIAARASSFVNEAMRAKYEGNERP